MIGQQQRAEFTGREKWNGWTSGVEEKLKVAGMK